MKTKLLTYLFVVFLVNSSVMCQPGTLDSDFNANGIVTTPFGNHDVLNGSALIQPDNKIVVAGSVYNSIDYDLALVRYNADGTLDNSFGINGKATASVGKSNDYSSCASLLDNRKILVGGYYNDPVSLNMFLSRFNADGSLDSTFGIDGIDTVAFGTDDDVAYSMKVQPDGKILLSGFSYVDFSNHFALARFNSEGFPDNTFGTDGKVTTQVGVSNDISYSMELQTDGKILLGGTSYDGMLYDFAVVRYNADGTLDSTFDVDGKVLTSINSTSSMGYALTIQNDGKILLAGDYDNDTYHNFAVVRYNADGTLDHSFSMDGKSTITIDGEHTNYCDGMTLEQDGKIVVTGNSRITLGNDFDICLVRFNTDGSVDTSFGTNGSVLQDINDHSEDSPWSVVMQPDGRIVVAGIAGEGGFISNNFVVLRYLSGLDLTNPTALTYPTANDNFLMVYPNPATDNLSIAYSLPQDEIVSVALYDLQGNLLKQLISGQRKLAGANEELINLSKQLPQGTYLLRFSNNSESHFSRIIVE
jgi:uncharacterized delta-60 repeat protein